MVKSPHVVCPVGELDQQNADVFDIARIILRKFFRLLFFPAGSSLLSFVIVNQVGNLRPEKILICSASQCSPLCREEDC
jgi:hypothetical protein